MNRIFRFLLVTATALACVCCAKEGDGIKSIRITSGEHFELYVGRTLSLDVEVTPSSADLSKINWTSDNPSVATVTNGFVTGVSGGQATITASCGKAFASATVSVTEINVTHFSLSTPEQVVPGGAVEVLVSDIQPDYADARNVLWSLVDSGNMEYFSITDVQADRVLVRAASDAKDGYWCELYGRNLDKSFHQGVKVTAIYKPLQSLSLPATLMIPEGDSEEIKCSTNPSFLTVPVDINWSSSDPSVATVESNGEFGAIVHAIKESSTPVTITATDSKSGISASCKVTVIFKRVIKSDAKVGFYWDCTEVVRDKLYRVSNPVTSATQYILPCHSPNYSIIVGLDDGYALSADELEATLSTSGSIISECRNFSSTRPYRLFARIEEKDASGSITVRIPNGSTATMNFRTQVSTFSMEKEGSDGFTAFARNCTTVPVGGTFTITRPAKEERTARYQFCMNSGSDPVREEMDRTTMIGNWHSWNTYVTDFTCKALTDCGALNDFQILSVSSSTPAGTYDFINESKFYPCFNDLTFKVIIK